MKRVDLKFDLFLFSFMRINNTKRKKRRKDIKQALNYFKIGLKMQARPKEYLSLRAVSSVD